MMRLLRPHCGVRPNDAAFHALLRSLTESFGTIIVGQLRDCASGTSSLMNPLRCQKCGADVSIPDLPAEGREHVTAIAHGTGRLQAVLELRDRARIGLGNAKAVVFHLAGEGGACHWCGTRLTEDVTEQDCPKCRSLNLIW